MALQAALWAVLLSGPAKPSVLSKVAKSLACFYRPNLNDNKDGGGPSATSPVSKEEMPMFTTNASDSVVGGCCLAAAELSSSKQYVSVNDTAGDRQCILKYMVRIHVHAA